MQQVWRNRWRNAAWAVLGASTLVLSVAAMYKKSSKICTGVEVSFENEGDNYFIDDKGVIAILKTGGVIQGQEINNINLGLLESRLEKDKWIANAELFFDNKQVLQVQIREKEPVARVFTTGGSSFYIDSACRRLPLSDRLSARVTMFTGFPSDRQVLAKPDSQLLADVKNLAMFIRTDEFWKAQVAQVDITASGFEMYPTVGSHVVVLGKGGDYQQKFDRLFSFYTQVWTKVGLERYEKLDVQFDGQVVATFKGSRPAIVDTAKAKELIDEMIATGKSVVDSSAVVAEDKPLPKSDSALSAKPKTVVSTIRPVDTKSKNAVVDNKIKQALLADTKQRQTLAKPQQPVKGASVKPVVVKASAKPEARIQQQAGNAKQETVKKQPKAVMKKTT